MDITVITDLISNIGFPISVCIAMFWYINKKDEEHNQEVDGLRQSLDKNTEAVTRLLEHLEQIK